METCYHYLFFESESIPKAQPKFKCCPPIREAENRNKLWEALQEGIIDLVVSDHSPCTPDLKGRLLIRLIYSQLKTVEIIWLPGEEFLLFSLAYQSSLLNANEETLNYRFSTILRKLNNSESC